MTYKLILLKQRAVTLVSELNNGTRIISEVPQLEDFIGEGFVDIEVVLNNDLDVLKLFHVGIEIGSGQHSNGNTQVL